MERLESRARPAGKAVVGAKELDQLAMQIGGAFDQQHGGLARRAEISQRGAV